jgi:hypothetical protein
MRSPPFMDSNLERYLNDHLAGSLAAIDVLTLLSDKSEDSSDRDFYSELLAKVKQDRELLESLLEKTGEDRSAFREAAGGITSKASMLKLRWEGLSPESLGLLEAIEMLALGIEGKRRLWLLLGTIATFIPEWQGTDFEALEANAKTQGDAVEQRRIVAGKSALLMRPAARH